MRMALTSEQKASMNVARDDRLDRSRVVLARKMAANNLQQHGTRNEELLAKSQEVQKAAGSARQAPVESQRAASGQQTSNNPALHQARCYLCETPKQEYSLLHSFSEIVCRGCVNYEGPDRIEQLIVAARRSKDGNCWLQQQVFGYERKLNPELQPARPHPIVRQPLGWFQTERAQLARPDGESHEHRAGYFFPSSPGYQPPASEPRSPLSNGPTSPREYSANSPVAPRSERGYPLQSEPNATNSRPVTISSLRDPTLYGLCYDPRLLHAARQPEASHQLAKPAVDESSIRRSASSDSNGVSNSYLVQHLANHRRAPKQDAPASPASTASMVAAAANLSGLFAGSVADMRPIDLNSASALNTNTANYQAYLDQSFRRALYVDQQIRHMAQVRQQQQVMSASGQQYALQRGYRPIRFDLDQVPVALPQLSPFLNQPASTVSKQGLVPNQQNLQHPFNQQQQSPDTLTGKVDKAGKRTARLSILSPPSKRLATHLTSRTGLRSPDSEQSGDGLTQSNDKNGFESVPIKKMDDNEKQTKNTFQTSSTGRGAAQRASSDGTPNKQQLICLICGEALDSRHFVQCPSIAAHKFCFACTKVSIQQQRLGGHENPNSIDQDKGKYNWKACSNSRELSLFTCCCPVYCPSGKKCPYASESTPWIFMVSRRRLC